MNRHRKFLAIVKEYVLIAFFLVLVGIGVRGFFAFPVLVDDARDLRISIQLQGANLSNLSYILIHRTTQLETDIALNIGGIRHAVEAQQESVTAIVKLAEQNLENSNRVIVSINDTLKSLQKSEGDVSGETVKTLAAMQDTLKAATASLKTSQDLLLSIKRTADDQNIAKTLDEVHGTVAHLDSTAASIDTYVKRITKPVAWWRQAINFVFDTGSKARILTGK